MKAFFLRYKKLHIWLLVSIGLIGAWWFGRHCRPVMNVLADRITYPLRAAIGRLCFLVDFSVMEVLVAGLILWGVIYLVRAIVLIRREKGQRRSRLYRSILFVLCVSLPVCDGFCLLWGVNFWTDSFQEKSGIYAEPVAPEELLEVTVYVARQLLEAADDVPRDENGVFAVSCEEILAKAPEIYTAVEQQFPFMEFDDPGVKAMCFSRLMSRMDFTGFYCAYTGESNVNVDSPACMLPSTIAHELAHQRGIASEQECNFLAVLAATTSGEEEYVYSGWLKAFIHVGNALYRLSPDLYWMIREQLPEGVQADLAYNNAYWEQFNDTVVQKASTTVYDGLLKSYGDERGIQSYGTVVDMLVAYYKDFT
jgi:hypothetical protein